MIPLATLLSAVQYGLTKWKDIKALIQGGTLAVADDAGNAMSLAELEPHILAAEDARDATSAHAQDRINKRHAGD